MSVAATTAAASFLGIEAGDWLSAITNMLAIIFAVVIAARIAPKAAERSARRDQCERLLRVLISTSPMPANPEYQGAIALIPIDFKGNKRVLDARSEYLAFVNTSAPTDEAAATEHYNKTVQKQADLIAAIAQELDFDLTTEALQTGRYVSKGFVDREELHLEAMRAWPRIAAALERNNDMFAWTLSNGGQPQAGSAEQEEPPAKE